MDKKNWSGYIWLRAKRVKFGHCGFYDTPHGAHMTVSIQLCITSQNAPVNKHMCANTANQPTNLCLTANMQHNAIEKSVSKK